MYIIVEGFLEENPEINVLYLINDRTKRVLCTISSYGMAFANHEFVGEYWDNIRKFAEKHEVNSILIPIKFDK